MTDNVIILGAGASVDAGIPLLANFVEKMWEFAITGKHNGEPLSDADKKIFDDAIKVRNELDSYHGRASFNDRNIEDILSLLSFNLIEGKKSDREKLNRMIKAISRTIELTCTVKHDGNLNYVQQEYVNSLYSEFWNGLFDKFASYLDVFPAIITFNYDLVLERSLFQVLTSHRYISWNEDTAFSFDGIILKYYYKLVRDLTYKSVAVKTWSTERGGKQANVALVECQNNELRTPLNVEILKLHGSLNFLTEKAPLNEEYKPTNVVENPYLLPPIINKWVSKNEQAIWSTGLKRLREAKNIIIIGYSLPQTDIYMQYFLRAGVGPNLDLNKIIVYNPVLFTSGRENDAMRERFGSCFSSQLQSRIVFTPTTVLRNYENDINVVEKGIPGTFEHFILSLYYDKNLFFG